MTVKHTLLAATLLLTGLIGCSSSPDEIDISEKTSLQSEYEKAKKNLESGAYFPASEILSGLDSRYPFGPHSHQVQLDLIYVYYKMGKSAQAIAAIDRFLRLNPNHQNLDYVLYIRGLVNIQMAQNAFQEAFGIDRHDRDVSTLRSAFNDFKQIIQEYPESKYVSDAQQRMVYLKNFMAKTEIAVAEYYIERQAFAAAASRAKYVLETFPDSAQLQRSLEIMVLSYEELKLDDLKTNAEKVLDKNFPNRNKLLFN